MTSIVPLANTFTTAQPINATGDDQLDQAAFLRLMTTQIKLQDPFKPLDNNAMVAQMAQFSSVAGITEMNASLKSMAAALTQNRLGNAANWLDNYILVNSNFAAPDPNGQYAGEFTLDAPSDNLSIDFLNDRGEIVQAIELGPQEVGPIVFSWDSKNPDGIALPYGPLRVRVNGGATSGMSTWAYVNAVKSPADGGNAQLMTGLGAFAPSEALRLG
jgi:flagellar basal-body rod modification protein FlgD